MGWSSTVKQETLANIIFAFLFAAIFNEPIFSCVLQPTMNKPKIFVSSILVIGPKIIENAKKSSLYHL